MRAFLARISKRTWIILGGLVIVVAIVMVLSARGRANAATAFQTIPVKRGELTASVGATGTVRAIQSAVLDWQIDGVVDAVNVNVGDKVQRGDVLATLDQTQLPQSVIIAKSDLVSAQKALDDATSDTASAQAAIDLQNAKDAYKRAYDYRLSLNGKQWIEEVRINYVNGQQIPEIKWRKGFADPGTIQDADNDLALKKAMLDDAQRAYDRLKEGPNSADIAAAQARVDAAQATLNLARIIAPIGGTVTQAGSLPGDVVGSSASSALSSASSQTGSSQTSGQASQGETAFRIDDLSRLLVDVQVSEVDINAVSLDQQAELTLDAIPNAVYHGSVIKVSQAGDVSSGAVNFTVTVELIDVDELVKPGMTAAVTITINQVKDQLLVPNRAVRLTDGQRTVYILKDGQPQRVAVSLGASSDTQSVLIGGDIKEGDLIILNPPVENGGPFGGPGGG